MFALNHPKIYDYMDTRVSKLGLSHNEKVMLVNGKVFLTDKSLRDGRIVGVDGSAAETTPVNAFLDAQIAEIKRLAEEKNEINMRIVVFLEGDQDQLDILKAYLGDYSPSIDDWVLVKDMGERARLETTLLSHGIGERDIAGVITDTRAKDKNTVYDYFVVGRRIKKEQYAELDANTTEIYKERVPIDTMIHAVQNPTLLMAAESILILGRHKKGDSLLVMPANVSFPVEQAKIMNAFVERVEQYNKTIQTAA